MNIYQSNYMKFNEIKNAVIMQIIKNENLFESDFIWQ